MRSRLTTSLAAAAVALTLATAVPAAAHGPAHPGPGHHHPGHPAHPGPGHPGHGPGHPGQHRPTTYLLDPVGDAADDVYPEGVAAHGEHFYVSSTTDGTIYRGRLDQPKATPFLPGGQDGRIIAVGLKVDGHTLLVAGGFTGRVWAYDLRTRALTGSWEVVQDGTPTFVNDLAISPRGDIYVTDSMRPVLYKIDAKAKRTTTTQLLEPVVSFEGTEFTFDQDVNANGLVIAPDGRTAIVAKTRTGQLFRVGLTDGSVSVVDLHGGSVQGDGLLLDGHRLLAAEWSAGHPQSVVTVHLDPRFTSGRVVSRTTHPTFDDPTTIARAGRDLLVVNSQFDTRSAGGTPEPFTVTRIPVP